MARAALRAAARAARLPSCVLPRLAPILLLPALAVLASCGPSGPLSPPQAYGRYCARCHGEDGRGDPKAVRLNPKLDLVRSEMVREGDLTRVRGSIDDGRGAMPAFRHKLSVEEIEALSAYTIERFGGGGG